MQCHQRPLTIRSSELVGGCLQRQDALYVQLKEAAVGGGLGGKLNLEKKRGKREGKRGRKRGRKGGREGATEGGVERER